MRRVAIWKQITTALLTSGMALEHAHRHRNKKVWKEERHVRERDRSRYPVHFDTLRLLILFGLAGVLVDVDHLLSGMARTTHLPIAVLCGIVLCGALALDYRRVHKHRVEDAEAA